MKHSKTKTILTAFFLGITLFANAQSTEPVLIKLPKPTLSVGYGSIMPSSSTKDAFFTKSSSIGLDYSLPLTKRGWGPKGNYLSLNIGGTYNFGGSGNPSVALPSAFAIAGQTSSSIAYKGVDPRNPGFFTFAGPQANFNFGKFTICPMLLAGYFSTTQKELSAVQTTQYNGQSYDFTLTKMPETKTSGFAITPKMRLQYVLTNGLGFFMEGAYTTGPKIETQLTKLIPDGAPQQGTYDINQVQNGIQQKGEITKSTYSAMSFGGGISFAFGGKRKGWDGKTKTSDKGWNGKNETAKNDEFAKGLNGDTDKKNIDPTLIQNIQVSANGGVENLAKEITKSGKSKASVVMDKGKKVLKVVTQDGEYFNSDFFTFDNNPTGPSNIMNGGYTTSCRAYQCQVGCDLINGSCSPCSVGSEAKGCTQIRHNEWWIYSHDYISIVEGLIPIDPNNTSEPHIVWDGTIKGLFDIKSETISVAKNGGIEKLIDNINKGGKGKASLYKLGVKEFIKVETRTKSENISDFYAIDDNTDGQFRYINNGSYNPRCTNRTGCNDCRLDGELNPVTGSGYLCKCGDTSSTVSAPDCNFSNGTIKITNFVISSQIKNLALTLEPDGTTLTTGSVKNIKDLMLQSFPKATFVKAEIIKEQKDRFVKVQLDDNGNPITLINMTYIPNNPGWILISCSGTCNGSVYGCESKNVNILGACNCAGDNHCFGISHLFHGINATITIEK